MHTHTHIYAYRYVSPYIRQVHLLLGRNTVLVFAHSWLRSLSRNHRYLGLQPYYSLFTKDSLNSLLSNDVKVLVHQMEDDCCVWSRCVFSVPLAGMLLFEAE